MRGMAVISTAQPQHRSPDFRRPDGQPVRVLVVDDESTLTDLLSMALRYEGWDVRGAWPAAAAMRCRPTSRTRWAGSNRRVPG